MAAAVRMFEPPRPIDGQEMPAQDAGRSVCMRRNADDVPHRCEHLPRKCVDSAERPAGESVVAASRAALPPLWKREAMRGRYAQATRVAGGRMGTAPWRLEASRVEPCR
eukprot:scaffold20025_cov149-Isochrysis_galbana.AAC.4